MVFLKLRTKTKVLCFKKSASNANILLYCQLGSKKSKKAEGEKWKRKRKNVEVKGKKPTTFKVKRFKGDRSRERKIKRGSLVDAETTRLVLVIFNIQLSNGYPRNFHLFLKLSEI